MLELGYHHNVSRWNHFNQYSSYREGRKLSVALEPRAKHVARNSHANVHPFDPKPVLEAIFMIDDKIYELVNKAAPSMSDKVIALSFPKLFETRLGNWKN